MKLFTRKDAVKERESNLEQIRSQETVAIQALQAKIAAINEIDVIYPVKLAEAQRRLAEVELKLRTFFLNEEKEIVALENRRFAALAPVINEIVTLEKVKLEAEQVLILARDERTLLDGREGELRVKNTEVQAAMLALKDLKDKTTTYVTRQQKDAQASIKEAMAITDALIARQAEAREAIAQSLSEKEYLERARELSIAATVAADERIALEQAEQIKTDGKRRMLAMAIDELKKKGLWHKQHETKTQ